MREYPFGDEERILFTIMNLPLSMQYLTSLMKANIIVNQIVGKTRRGDPTYRERQNVPVGAVASVVLADLPRFTPHSVVGIGKEEGKVSSGRCGPAKAWNHARGCRGGQAERRIRPGTGKAFRKPANGWIRTHKTS
jgi:hypothetical protein